MCVIMIAEKRKPTMEEIRLADISNPHGIGISWVEDGYVHWKKGLSAKQAYKVVDAIPSLPFVLHARLSSVGKSDDKTLNHPFVADQKATNTLSGKTKKPVVFHNGHWSSFNIALMGKPNQPKGSMSDTRAIAWLAFLDKGKTFSLVDEKLAILRKNSVVTIYGDFSNDDGLRCSNMHWKNKIGYTNSTISDSYDHYYRQMNWERTTPVIGNKKADKKKKNGLTITNKKKDSKVVDEKVGDVCSSGNLSSSWDAVARQKDSEQLEIDKRLLEEHPKFNDPHYWSS